MITGTLVHALMVCILYFWLDWGYEGVLLATGFMFVARAAVNIGLVTFRNDVRKFDDVHIFSKETVSNLGPLLKKSFSSMAL